MVRVLDKMHYGVSYRESYDVIRLLPSDFMTFPVYIYMYVIWMNFSGNFYASFCVSLLFLCWLGILVKKKKKAKYRGSKNCVKSSLDDRLIILPIMLILIRIYFHLYAKCILVLLLTFCMSIIQKYNLYTNHFTQFMLPEIIDYYIKYKYVIRREETNDMKYYLFKECNIKYRREFFMKESYVKLKHSLKPLKYTFSKWETIIPSVSKFTA